MNRNHLIRNLYQPLQPTVGHGLNANIDYQEFAPSAALGQYIFCYWTLWSETALQSPFTYRIVSDGCVDLLINCTKFERLIVAGTANASTSVSFNHKLAYFGIRFLPGSFRCFFPIPLKEISNNMMACQDIWGNRMEAFEARLFSAESTKERIDIAEAYLLQQLAASNRLPDTRLLALLEKIYQQHGHISIENGPLSDISPRQLRRLFDKYIGLPPKTFARIIRFQSVLRAMMHEPKANWGKVCFDFGYYDQSHFIHEFKGFFGISPASVKLPQK